MYSKLVSISQSEDLQKITELSEKQMQIMLFLLFAPEQEFSYSELKRQLNEFGFSFNDSTLSRNMKKLSERELIHWDRAPNLRYDKRSKIKLIIDGLEQKLAIQEQVEKAYSEYEKVKIEAESMDEADIVHELIEIVKKYSGACLYLRLNHAQELFDDAQFTVGYLWMSLYSELLQELYIDVLKERGKPAIIEAIHHFLQSGTNHQ